MNFKSKLFLIFLGLIILFSSSQIFAMMTSFSFHMEWNESRLRDGETIFLDNLSIGLEYGNPVYNAKLVTIYDYYEEGREGFLSINTENKNYIEILNPGEEYSFGKVTLKMDKNFCLTRGPHLLIFYSTTPSSGAEKVFSAALNDFIPICDYGPKTKDAPLQPGEDDSKSTGKENKLAYLWILLLICFSIGVLFIFYKKFRGYFWIILKTISLLGILFFLSLTFIFLFHYEGRTVILIVIGLLSLLLLVLDQISNKLKKENIIRKNKRFIMIILFINIVLIVLGFFSPEDFQRLDDRLFNNFDLYLLNFSYDPSAYKTQDLPPSGTSTVLPEFLHNSTGFISIQGCKNKEFGGVYRFYFINIQKDCYFEQTNLNLLPRVLDFYRVCGNQSCNFFELILINKRKNEEFLSEIKVAGETSKHSAFYSKEGVAVLTNKIRDLDKSTMILYDINPPTKNTPKLLGEIWSEFGAGVNFECKNVPCKNCQLDIIPQSFEIPKGYEIKNFSFTTNWGDTIELPKLERDVKCYTLPTNSHELIEMVGCSDVSFCQGFPGFN